MHLWVDGGVFYRARCLQNETGDEFCRSHEIKNASTLKCILYFLQHIAEKICQAGRRMKNRANVRKGVKRELREREGVMERRIIGRDETKRTVERGELERDGTGLRTGNRGENMSTGKKNEDFGKKA